MIGNPAFDTTVNVDLVRLVAFILGFLLCGGLARLSWTTYQTRSETGADAKVLNGITLFSVGTTAVVVSSLAHVTDQVHRQNVTWISPLLISAFLVMFIGLVLAMRGQGGRLQGDARLRRRPLDHPLDVITEKKVQPKIGGDDVAG